MRRSLRTFELFVMASLFYSLPVPSKCKSLFLCNGACFLWSAQQQQRSTCFCANNAATAVCTFASAIKAWTHTHTHTGFVHFIKLSHGMQAAVINCGGLGAAAINPSLSSPHQQLQRAEKFLFCRGQNPLANKELSKQTPRVSELPGQLAAAPSLETRCALGESRARSYVARDASKSFFCCLSVNFDALFRHDLWLFSNYGWPIHDWSNYFLAPTHSWGWLIYLLQHCMCMLRNFLLLPGTHNFMYS